jgi:AraC-like DNA-binding protein
MYIELLLGSIGVILGLFFALFLFIDRRRQPKANIFLAIYLLAFSLRIGKSLFHNYFEIDPTIRVVFLTTLLCVGPAIWLYVLHIIKVDKKKNILDFIHFLPFFIFLLLSWWIPNDGSKIFGLFYDFLIAHMFAYTLYTFLFVLKHRDEFKSDRELKIRSWLYLFLSVNLVVIVFYFLTSKYMLSFYIGLSFLFSFVIIFLSLWALKNPFLFKTLMVKYNNSPLDDKESERLIGKLRALMETEKPHIDPSLTLPKLSSLLDVSPKELSQVINQKESLNYSQFVSKYRVQEVQRLMNESSHSKLTIAAIAYDSGFNSISSFNAAFKKHTKKTAIQYRKSLESK